MAEKPHINVVFIGHVDHGKSTLVGRLLLDSGSISPYIIEKYRKEAEERGMAGFEFAYVMDGLKEERERGVTINIAHKRFDSDKYYFTIIDAPGHRDFVKNMITGTSQADAAVLVVAASEGIMAQTKEHLWLAKVLGVQQLIVVINKLDATRTPYDQARFEEVKKDFQKILPMVGYRLNSVTIIPVSALKGDNVAKASDKMGWWKGETFLKALDTLNPPRPLDDMPLRLPIQDVYNITGVGAVPIGRIETGMMRVGDKITIVPSRRYGGVMGEVRSIEMHHEMEPNAHVGDNVGFNVRGISKKDIRRGDVAGPVDNPPSVAKKFKAQVMVINHPSVITEGYTPVFHSHTAQVACRFSKLLARLDPRTGSIAEENPDYLKTGQAAIVEITPTRPMVIEEQATCKQLSSFAIRDLGQTVAAGVCIKILEKLSCGEEDEPEGVIWEEPKKVRQNRDEKVEKKVEEVKEVEEEEEEDEEEIEEWLEVEVAEEEDAEDNGNLKLELVTKDSDKENLVLKNHYHSPPQPVSRPPRPPTFTPQDIIEVHSRQELKPKAIHIDIKYKKVLPGIPLNTISSSAEKAIPDYTLTHKIGSGGFATVYKALDNHGNPVALKLPKFIDETIDFSHLQKFKTEAEIWNKLTHENIVGFYEAKTIPMVYLAIELMEGGSLKDLMTHYSLSTGETVDIMLQVLDGISYAHRMATIHRDLKPENILFTSDGTAKVSDWGIGKFMASESAKKTMGTKGTLLYSAPEQISKKKYGAVDWQTDIFQMGIVFYEVLTGVNPFIDEDPIGIIGKITNEDPDPPSSINPEIPPEIDNIVMGALRKRKEDRWRSADVMYDRLSEIVK